ncbi:MAG: DUF1850 domain-containing protein [Synergistetes bacterium]|nr:DUF1850 domain-containing protein [Synergistota bacterium]
MITSLLFLPIKLLEIRTEEGTYICSLFFNSEVIITLSYIHSVSLTEVIDKFKVTGDGIWAIESRWQQFDAGQPIDFNRIENGFFVKEMRLFLGNEWIYWFIPLNRPSIRLDGKYLVQEMRKEGKVKFKLRKEPLVFIIFSWEGVKWIN